MKQFAAVIAILLSVSSMTSAYKFDAARDKRAKEFYRNLQLAKIDNYSPEEDTQFFVKEVGG